MTNFRSTIKLINFAAEISDAVHFDIKTRRNRTGLQLVHRNLIRSNVNKLIATPKNGFTELLWVEMFSEQVW